MKYVVQFCKFRRVCLIFVSNKELFGSREILNIVLYYLVPVIVRIKQRKHLEQHMWYMKIYIDILGLLKYHTFITYFKTAQ